MREGKKLELRFVFTGLSTFYADKQTARQGSQTDLILERNYSSFASGSVCYPLRYIHTSMQTQEVRGTYTITQSYVAVLLQRCEELSALFKGTLAVGGI